MPTNARNWSRAKKEPQAHNNIRTMRKLSKSTINQINKPWPETKLPRNYKHMWARLRYGQRQPRKETEES